VGWAAFVKGLRPVTGANGRTVGGVETSADAEGWQTLAAALQRVDGRAAHAGIDLPEAVAGWAQWVPLVGRLSFPGGSVAARLNRLGAIKPSGDNDTDRFETNDTQDSF
jgi:hypothetical protein